MKHTQINNCSNNKQSQQALDEENFLQAASNYKSSRQGGYRDTVIAAQTLVSLISCTQDSIFSFEPSEIASEPIYQRVDPHEDLILQACPPPLEIVYPSLSEISHELSLPPLSPLSSLSDLSIYEMNQNEDQTILPLFRLDTGSNIISSEQDESSDISRNEHTNSHITLRPRETRIRTRRAIEGGLVNQGVQQTISIRNVEQLNVRSGYRAALRHLRNVEVEEKEQGIFQGIEILYSRLQATGFTIFPIKTNHLILNHVFTRDFLSSTYGGNTIDTYPRVDLRKMWKGGYRRFMCLNLLYNPHAPQFPGAPGLYYALRDPRRWPNREELVFSRYGTNRWNLMGKYSIRRSRPLSGQEFSSLDKDAQQTWMNNIWSYQWGNFTLAAIYLRRARGREPSDAEIALYAKTKESFLKRNVSPAQVKKAFLDGQEKLNVWTLKCIGYDEPFKRRLTPKALLKAAGRQATKDIRNNRSSTRKRHASPADEQNTGRSVRHRRL